MKKTLLAIMLVAIALLAGCASTEKAAPVVETDGTPDWVYMDISTQDVHYAAGYGNMSNKQNSIKRAQAEARNLIAEWVNTSVNEIITTYTNDAGSEANRQAMDAFETLSIQNASAILSGVKQEDMYEEPDGGIWVLMSIPVENVESQMYGYVEEAIESTPFERNEAAEEANNMMNDAIAKYFGTADAE